MTSHALRRALRALAASGLLSILVVTGVSAADGSPPPVRTLQSIDELTPRRDAVMAAIRNADLPNLNGYAAGINPNTGTIGVTLVYDDGVVGAAAADQTPLNLGSDVTVTTTTGRPVLSASLAGGATIVTSRSGRCTAGFGVKLASGKQGFLTSGHCFDPVTPANQQTFTVDGLPAAGERHSDYLTSGSDWGVITVNGTPGEHAVARRVGKAPFIFSVKGIADPAIDTAICKYGRATETRCGRIALVGTAITIEALKDSAGNAISPSYHLANLIQSNVCSAPGDSGGPVYKPTPGGVLAVGLHVAGVMIDNQQSGGGCSSNARKYLSWHTPLSATDANTTDPNAPLSIMTE